MKIVLAKLNRRSFFGVAAGAAAAGPLAVKSVAQEVEKMGFGYPTEFGHATAGSCQPIDPDGNWALTRIARIRDELLNIKRPKVDHHHISRLDSDLTANRSFSLAGRLNIQRERAADREVERQRNYLEQELESLLKQASKKFF